MRKVIVFSSVLGLLCLAANDASASLIDFAGAGKATGVTIQFNGGSNWNVTAGELKWNWEGTPPAGFSQTFYTYCVDLMNTVTSVENVTMKSSDLITASGGVDAGAKAAWLYNTYAGGIRTSGSSTDAAALQVAIWEALYDTSASLSGGAFKLITTGAVATQATNYLNTLYLAGGGYNTSHNGLFLDAAAGAGQDQMTAPVPEPASLMLLGTGLLGLVRTMRRRKPASTVQ